MDLDQRLVDPRTTAKVMSVIDPIVTHLIVWFSRMITIAGKCARTKDEEQEGNRQPDGQHEVHVRHARAAAADGVGWTWY